MKHRTKNSERLDTAIYFPEVGRTKSEFKESCDINNMLAKYQQTGNLPLMKQNPIYGDFSEPTTYQEAQNTLIVAQQQFDGLPSEIRKQFDNDPEQFLEFCNDPKNANQMRKMGILEQPEIPDKIVQTKTEEKVKPDEKRSKTTKGQLPLLILTVLSHP